MKNWEFYKDELLEILAKHTSLSGGKPVECGDCFLCDWYDKNNTDCWYDKDSSKMKTRLKDWLESDCYKGTERLKEVNFHDLDVGDEFTFGGHDCIKISISEYFDKYEQSVRSVFDYDNFIRDVWVMR